MEQQAREAHVRSIIEAVRWTEFPDALGTRVDLTEPLVRITLDRRLPNEERYYCSGAMYNHICCQGSMGEVTLPVTRVVHRLLEADLAVKPDLLYELLEVHRTSWTELPMTDPDTGEQVVMWEATFRELYRHKDLYLRDLDRLQPSECPALLDLLWLLSPKYPEIIDHAVQRSAQLEGDERAVIEAKIEQMRAALEDDKADHDHRLDIEP
ncbi:hypothetical protein [Glycomyces tritici]|uniref:Uncharacterized protein n=1 Tax=Glycomyces tritici TaxID=2665176 RepID=A0ABT7YVC0_9ACTN|nr:hypothetical protein [Glycomyces tritici]MDN3242577.1 hypothetical protein [Glycomyces tritici]